jgi:hypothetical protein
VGVALDPSAPLWLTVQGTMLLLHLLLSVALFLRWDRPYNAWAPLAPASHAHTAATGGAHHAPMHTAGECGHEYAHVPSSSRSLVSAAASSPALQQRVRPRGGRDWTFFARVEHQAWHDWSILSHGILALFQFVWLIVGHVWLTRTPASCPATVAKTTTAVLAMMWIFYLVIACAYVWYVASDFLVPKLAKSLCCRVLLLPLLCCLWNLSVPPEVSGVDAASGKAPTTHAHNQDGLNINEGSAEQHVRSASIIGESRAPVDTEDVDRLADAYSGEGKSAMSAGNNADDMVDRTESASSSLEPARRHSIDSNGPNSGRNASVRQRVSPQKRPAHELAFSNAPLGVVPPHMRGAAEIMYDRTSDYTGAVPFSSSYALSQQDTSFGPQHQSFALHAQVPPQAMFAPARVPMAAVPIDPAIVAADTMQARWLLHQQDELQRRLVGRNVSMGSNTSVQWGTKGDHGSLNASVPEPVRLTHVPLPTTANSSVGAPFFVPVRLLAPGWVPVLPGTTQFIHAPLHSQGHIKVPHAPLPPASP